MAKQIETYTLSEAAKILGTTNTFVKYGIESGMLPIGAIVPNKTGTKDRAIIPKARLEKWIAGDDIWMIRNEIAAVVATIKDELADLSKNA